MSVTVHREDSRGSGAKKEDRPMARVCGCRSHLLGHLVDPWGGAVAQVRTPQVPHDMLRQALERSNAWRQAQEEETEDGGVMET